MVDVELQGTAGKRRRVIRMAKCRVLYVMLDPDPLAAAIGT